MYPIKWNAIDSRRWRKHSYGFRWSRLRFRYMRFFGSRWKVSLPVAAAVVFFHGTSCGESIDSACERERASTGGIFGRLATLWGFTVHRSVPHDSRRNTHERATWLRSSESPSFPDVHVHSWSHAHAARASNCQIFSRSPTLYGYDVRRKMNT